MFEDIVIQINLCLLTIFDIEMNSSQVKLVSQLCVIFNLLSVHVIHVTFVWQQQHICVFHVDVTHAKWLAVIITRRPPVG